MEIKPHPALPDRLGIFRLKIDDVVEGMSMLSAIDAARGILLRDRWLSAHLSRHSDRYPVTVSVSSGQLNRAVAGLESLAQIAASDHATEAEIGYITLADIIRPHVPPVNNS